MCQEQVARKRFALAGGSSPMYSGPWVDNDGGAHESDPVTA